MAASSGASRASAQLPPHRHPHHPHYQLYDAYQPTSPPPGPSQPTSARGPFSSKHLADHRHQQQQQQQQQPSHGEHGYGPPPSPGSHSQQQHPMLGSSFYAPSSAQQAAAIQQSPVMPLQHLAPGPSRHPAPPHGYSPVTGQAHHPHPHSHHGQQPLIPQHYAHHHPPPHHMSGMAYYDAEMMDEAAHARYMAASQQHPHHPSGYPPLHPGMAPPPSNAFAQGHIGPLHPSQLSSDHPAHYPPPPPHPPPHVMVPATASKASASSQQPSSGAATSKQGGSKSKTSGSRSKDAAAKTKDKVAVGKSTASKIQASKEAKAEAITQAKEAVASSNESKKDKKRREVIDRIHRVHWDTVENREELFQHLQHRYMSEHTTLLTSPLFSRQYQLNLSMLTLQREAALRQVALLHAHQVEGARKSYESEVAKVEDEAKQARKLVRERLTAAVEDRRKKLKEEKEGGEGGIDTLMDSSSRPHATRKLRNKQSVGTSRRLALAAAAGELESGDESSAVGGPGAGSTAGGAGGAGGPTSSAFGKDRNRDGSLAIVGPSSSLSQLVGNKSMEATAPILGFGGLPELSLLEASLRVFDTDSGSSKVVNGSKKKGKSKKRRHAQQHDPPQQPSEFNLTEEGLSKRAKRKLDKDRLAFIALAAASIPACLTSGGGATGSGSLSASAGGSLIGGGGRAVRWEPGRSVMQLTGAKDYETESDLIRIRGGVGTGKRRRGAAAVAASAAAA